MEILRGINKIGLLTIYVYWGNSVFVAWKGIHSDIGYIEGNVQWVHKYVNILKHSLSVKDFIGLCSMVIKHFDDNYIPNDKFSVDIDNLDVMRLKRGGRFPERDRKK